jgi:hypothetical protein
MKPPRDAQPLRLGPDVISQLIPHRRPLVMVDAIVAYRHGASPTLWARRQISANEDIFTGFTSPAITCGRASMRSRPRSNDVDLRDHRDARPRA